MTQQGDDEARGHATTDPDPSTQRCPVMSVLFVIQLNRLFSVPGTSLTDVVGVGPIVVLAAGGALVYVAVQLRKQPSPAIGS